jgi:hypothetical protein
MIDAKKIRQLELAFQRILVMPISRGSFRQMQNAVLFCVDGNRDKATTLLEAIFKGDQTQSDPALKSFIEKYTIPVGVARDVAERGEFLSLITSDIIGHPELALFGNRIRKIDGNELEFITDVESTIHLVQHFASRLQEMNKLDRGKQSIQEFKADLKQLREHIDQLIGTLTE